jgi:hypothetical protein
VTCTTTRHYYPWWNANDLEWKCNDTKRLRTKDFKPGVFVEIIDPLDPRHTPLASIFLDPSPSIYQRTVFAELDLVSPRV